jgi:hypothetical protein
MIKSSNHSKETFSAQTQKQIENVLSRVGSFKTEVAEILEPFAPPPAKGDVREKIETLFLRFHAVAIQLQKRQRGKAPFQIEDEYDVQDLLHGLLKLFFDDIEPEEYCSSYCGTSPRIDFYLRNEKIFIEAKIANKNHRRKKIAEELILDKEYYSKKEGLKGIFCLVYDPYGIIENQYGFEKDLSEKNSHPEVRVFVIPRVY